MFNKSQAQFVDAKGNKSISVCEHVNILAFLWTTTVTKQVLHFSGAHKIYLFYNNREIASSPYTVNVQAVNYNASAHLPEVVPIHFEVTAEVSHNTNYFSNQVHMVMD